MIRDLKKNISATVILALPVIIGQLGQVLMGSIDVMMLGKIGYEAVSATGLANSILFLIIVIGFGIMAALSPLIAEANATDNKQKIVEYLHQGLWIGIIFGILINLLLYLGAPYLYLLDQPEKDTKLAIEFLRVISFSTVPMLLFLGIKGFTDGLSDTRPAMVITLLGLVLNIFFNYLFIEGNLGFPRMEVKGSALATTLTRIIMLGMMLIWVLSHKKYAGFRIGKHFFSYIHDTFFKILRIGIPSGLQYFFEVGSFVGVTIMLGWMGDEASQSRAAHQVAIALVSITYMIALGISTASSIRVGDALGRNDLRGIRDAGFTGLGIALIWMGFSALILIIFRHFLLNLYQIQDVFVQETAAKLLIIGAFFQLFDGGQVIGLGILRGIQDVKYPTIVTFIAYWIITIPLSYLLGFTFKLGVEGTWYAFVAGLGFAALFNNFRFHILTRDSVEKIHTLTGE